MIDWDRVATLREEVGAEDFDEVVELFLAEVEEVIDRIKSAPDLKRLEEDLHFLKGSALNLGFVDFSELCQEGELMSSKGQAGDVDLDTVLQTYGLSQTAFIDGIKTKFAA